MIRNRVQAIGDDVRALNAQRLQILAGGLRHGDIGSAAVDARGHSGLKEPTKPTEERARHRPLFAVAMVSKQHRRCSRNQASEEGDAVLGIDYRIHSAQVSQPQAAGQHRRPGTRIHAEFGATAAIAHAVAHLPARGIHVLGGAKDHLVALGRQVLAHALQVALRATALRVGGIAPA